MNTTMQPEDVRSIVHLLNWMVQQFYGDVRGWINRALDLRVARVLARQEEAVAKATNRCIWFGIGLVALLVFFWWMAQQQSRA